MYYAIEHTYGRHTGREDDEGAAHHIGSVYTFDRREDRDAWVHAASHLDGTDGDRDALDPSTRIDRDAIKASGVDDCQFDFEMNTIPRRRTRDDRR